jgi:hypothetical protein
VSVFIPVSVTVSVYMTISVTVSVYIPDSKLRMRGISGDLLNVRRGYEIDWSGL